MKLRIRDNSIRLRLTQTEVETVCSDGLAEAAVSLPGGGGLTYVLESTPVTVKATARFSDFACFAPGEGEDEADMLPRPLEGRD